MPKTNVIFTKRNEGGLFDETGNEVEIGDGTNTMAVNPDGSINVLGGAATQDVDIVAQSLGDLTVAATNLDIRDLVASTDNVAISDGTDSLAINVDAEGSASYWGYLVDNTV